MSNLVKVKSLSGSKKIYELPKEKADRLVKGGTHKIVKSGAAMNSGSKNLEKKEAPDMTSDNANSKGGRVVNLKTFYKKLKENGKSSKRRLFLRRNRNTKS